MFHITDSSQTSSTTETLERPLLPFSPHSMERTTQQCKDEPTELSYWEKVKDGWFDTMLFRPYLTTKEKIAQNMFKERLQLRTVRETWRVLDDVNELDRAGWTAEEIELYLQNKVTKSRASVAEDVKASLGKPGTTPLFSIYCLLFGGIHDGRFENFAEWNEEEADDKVKLPSFE